MADDEGDIKPQSSNESVENLMRKDVITLFSAMNTLRKREKEEEKITSNNVQQLASLTVVMKKDEDLFRTAADRVARLDDRVSKDEKRNCLQYCLMG